VNTFKKLFLNAFAVVSILVLSPTTSHATLGIGGVGDLGSFTGTLSYDDVDFELTVLLTNTSSDGFLTAFAFDGPDAISGVSLDDSPADFNHLLEGINVAPFGTRDFGVGVGIDSWLGGGTPSDGIPDGGGPEEFLFKFTGTGLGGLSDSSFENFIVRFKGFDGEPGSDKVTDGCEGSCEEVVPEPATMLLFGSGLLGGVFARRKKRS